MFMSQSISVLAKCLSIIMLLLVAVQAQEFFPSDYSSLLAESEFLHDTDESSVPLETQEIPHVHVSDETYFPWSTDLSQDFQDTNMVPVETQSHPDLNSLSSDSEDSNLPLGTQNSDSEDSKRRPPHQSPPPPPSESSLPKTPPSSSRGPSTPKACKAKCATTCLQKKVPILHNLCNKNCRRRCILRFSQLIYRCTIKCADSMPKNFKSDGKKAAGYVDNCYQKCINKF